MTLQDFQLIIIITVTIQIAALNWFSWNSHSWCGSTLGWTFFGNNLFNRTTDMGENVPPKLIFWFSVSRYMGFWRKNLKVVYGTPFPIEKVLFIFVVRHPIPWKMVMSSKIIFRSYFGKYIFKKVVKWKIFKTSFPTTKFILIFVARHHHYL